MKILATAIHTEVEPISSGIYYNPAKVRIHEVNNDSLFPVKFTYDYPGYRSLVFHDRKSKFTKLSNGIEGC